MPFHDNLRQARLAAGYKSREAAARAFGVCLSTWVRWEKGTQTPSLATLGTIGELLKIAPAKLLEESPASATISRREVTHDGFLDTKPNTVLRQDPPGDETARCAKCGDDTGIIVGATPADRYLCEKCTDSEPGIPGLTISVQPPGESP